MWTLEPNCIYSVKSSYEKINFGGIVLLLTISYGKWCAHKNFMFSCGCVFTIKCLLGIILRNVNTWMVSLAYSVMKMNQCVTLFLHVLLPNNYWIMYLRLLESKRSLDLKRLLLFGIILRKMQCLTWLLSPYCRASEN